MVYTKTLVTCSNEIIWEKRPLISSTGLISCFKNSFLRNKAKSTSLPSRFRTLCFDPSGSIFLVGDERGHIFVFFVSSNRLSSVRHAGISASASAFSTTRKSEVLISCEDASIRCIDVKTQHLICTLRGHKTVASSISFQKSGPLACTASSDSVILWDSTTWKRFRTLNAGPGVHQAIFGCDGKAISVLFRDDTILIWNVETLELKSKLMVTPQNENDVQSIGLTCFDISKDSRTVVAAGSHGHVYVWELESQVLVRVIEMPSSIQTIHQIHFFSNYNNIITILGNDGKLSFMNVTAKIPKIHLQINGNEKGLLQYAIDIHGKYAICSTSDGCILLYDLDVARDSARRVNELKKKNGLNDEKEELELHTHSAFGLLKSSQGIVKSLSPTSMKKKKKKKKNFFLLNSSSTKEMENVEKKKNFSKLIDNIFGSTSNNNNNLKKYINVNQNNIKNNNDINDDDDDINDDDKKEVLNEIENEPVINGIKKSSIFNEKEKLKNSKNFVSKQLKTTYPSLYQLSHLSKKETQINQRRLEGLLNTYGEYPEKYRLLVWRFLLRLPENNDAFIMLLKKGNHPSYENLYEKYPISSRRLYSRLVRILSCISYWSAVYGEVSYLPSLLFPFIKLFATDDLSAFETCLCILLNWGKDWLQTFPHPPLPILTYLEDQLSNFDPTLYQHFIQYEINSQIYGWSLLRSVFTEVLSREEWLRLWDHLITHANESSMIYASVLAYLKYFRQTLLSTKDKKSLQAFFHQQNPIDMKLYLKIMYKLFNHSTFQQISLSSTGVVVLNEEHQYYPLQRGQYPTFYGYPKFVVDYQLQERERIAIEEAELISKKKLLNELEEETQELNKQHMIWKTQQQSLLKAEEERRIQSVQEEKKRLNELKKIEEITRQRRLTQIAKIEKQARETIEQTTKIREAEYQRLQDHLALQKEKEEYEIQSRKEEEELLNMEFKAAQRVKQIQMQREAEERLRNLRNEYMNKAKNNELQDKIRQDAWKLEDEERSLRLRLEQEENERMHILNQELELQRQLEQEQLQQILEKETKLLTIGRERKLRQLAEDETQRMDKQNLLRKQEEYLLLQEQQRQAKEEMKQMVNKEINQTNERQRFIEREQRKQALDDAVREKRVMELNKQQEQFKFQQLLNQKEETLKQDGKNEHKMIQNTLFKMDEEKRQDKKAFALLNNNNNNNNTMSFIKNDPKKNNNKHHPHPHPYTEKEILDPPSLHSPPKSSPSKSPSKSPPRSPPKSPLSSLLSSMKSSSSKKILNDSSFISSDEQKKDFDISLLDLNSSEEDDSINLDLSTHSNGLLEQKPLSSSEDEYDDDELKDQLENEKDNDNDEDDDDDDDVMAEAKKIINSFQS